MTDQNTIRIRGARQHNLKNVDLDLARDRLIVCNDSKGNGKMGIELR
jgi:excinuclease ABC subunit A